MGFVTSPNSRSRPPRSATPPFSTDPSRRDVARAAPELEGLGLEDLDPTELELIGPELSLWGVVVCSAAQDGTCRASDAATSSVLVECVGHTESIEAVATHPPGGGCCIFTGSWEPHRGRPHS